LFHNLKTKQLPRMKQLKMFVVAVMILLPPALQAQTLKDATDAYNSAVQLIATDKSAAIVQFEKCLELCTAVGAEADTLKQSVSNGLPGMYYDVAMDSYKAKKIDEALAGFQKAAEVATKYGDEKIKQKALSTEPKLYFAIGNLAFNANDLDKALTNFKKATELDAQYTKAWLALGLVYRKKEDPTNLMAVMDKAIEAGMSENDQKSVDQATKVTRDYLMILSEKSKAKEDYTKALDYLKKAIGYDPKYSDAFYFTAVIYNKQSKWQDAVNAGKKALENLASGTDGAKIHYELGTAYMNLNDTENACAEFKLALPNKNYEQSAKYYIEQKLKCK
jgi:tetratricopeptide (TPR) repeat protein